MIKPRITIIKLVLDHAGVSRIFDGTIQAGKVLGLNLLFRQGCFVLSQVLACVIREVACYLVSKIKHSILSVVLPS